MLQLDTSYFKKNELGSCMEPVVYPGKLRVATATHVYYLDVKDIVRIQSISNYSKFFFASGQTLMVSKVLGYFEEMLTSNHFSRIHRTHLINLHYLKHAARGSMTKISLSNNEVLPVSRRKKKVLEQKMMALTL